MAKSAGSSRLAHQVEIEVAGSRAQLFRQQAELHRGHGAGRPPGTGTKAAAQIALVGDLQIDFIVLPHQPFLL